MTVVTKMQRWRNREETVRTSAKTRSVFLAPWHVHNIIITPRVSQVVGSITL